MLVKFSRVISVVLITCFLSQLLGCGTVLYPERKGQKAGQIDPAIAVFDAVGLLFYLIPGVIAFAVDFNNGTIYLPGGKRADVSPDELKRLQGKEGIDKTELSHLLQKRGIQVNVDDLEIQRVSSYQELDVKMKNANLLYASAN